MATAAGEPRIEPVEHDAGTLNIFATLARNEGLSKGFLRLGGHLLGGGVLPARTRELIILRVGWRCGSEYEFGQHTSIGKSAGLTDDEIGRLADCGTGTWVQADRELIDLADELCDDDEVSGGTWVALASRFTDAELLELVVLAGFYRMVSGMLNSVAVALEPGTAGWPPGATPERRAPRQVIAGDGDPSTPA
ncbi:MAG: carboxymuconolactone decarboxylase family protein [Acidimicrobiales bacterium]|jgi:alkylhydroperoxidase family enzyme